MNSDFLLVYVAHEYPARTQTFVVDEFECVSGLVDDAFLYSLNSHHRSERPTLLSGRWRLTEFGYLFRKLPVVGSGVVRSLRTSCSLRDFATQIYALSHSIRLAARIERLICKGERPVVIHAHFVGRTLEVASYARDLLASSRVVFVSATGHAADVAAPLNRERTADLVNGLDGVVAASKNVDRDFQKLADRAADVVVHCGVALPPLPVRAERKIGLPVKILTVARLVSKKGIDDAIRAASILQKQGLNFVWTVVGDGPERVGLLELCDSILSDRTAFELRGHLPHDEILTLMEQSDVFVLPSKRTPSGDVDGIPVVVMEAMARGLPVVCTSVGGMSEIADSTTALVVSVAQPDQIASAVGRIMSDEINMNRMVTSARERVEDQFAREAEARKLVTYFRTLVGGAR